MKRCLMLSLSAGALALGLSLGAAQAAMPILDPAPGVYAEAGVTLASHNTYQCRLRYRRCVRRCYHIANPIARQRCLRHCVRAYRFCIRHY
jgi:hypothetical protein